MGAQTRLHAADATRQLFERRDQRQPFDLAPQDNLAVRIKADKVKDILVDIDRWARARDLNLQYDA